MTGATTTTTPTATGGIESRSIDWVPENERHGKVWMQGPFWFLGNFQPVTAGIGLVGTTLLGLPLLPTVIASVCGVLFGTIFMAFHASQGPTFGLPQMMQSRAQLGFRGVILALIATAFTFIGFNVVDTVVIKLGLNGIFGWNTTVIAVVIAVIATVLAIYGHDWLHRVFQVLFWVSLPFWVILTVGILTGNAASPTPAEVPTSEFTWASMLAMFTIAASYNITYAPYVSDYSRYLPKDTRWSAIVASVFFGATGSPIWLMPLGAWLGSNLGATDPLEGIYTAGNNVFGGLGSVIALLSVLALVATMGLNAYSGMLTIVTAIDSLRPFRPTRLTRIVVIVALAVVWLVLGLALTDAAQALNNSLLVMLYLLAPWTAINLIDYFFVRRGHYAITDLFTPTGIYGSWAWRGIVALLAGIAVEIPFAVLNGEDAYVGVIAAKYLHHVDISWIVGMVVGGGLYLIFSRSLDREAEAAAVARSEKELAENGLVR
ncbi:MAG TPA: cytosine permease [Propionibacteriaceae bacterium]